MAKYDSDFAIMFLLLLIVAIVCGTVLLFKDRSYVLRDKKEEKGVVFTAGPESNNGRLVIYRVLIDGVPCLASSKGGLVCNTPSKIQIFDSKAFELRD